MRRALPLLAVSTLLGACCGAALAPPPGLTHARASARSSGPRARPTPPNRHRATGPTGEAIEGKEVEVEGVGRVIVLDSPTPSPAPSASPAPQP